MAIVSSEEYQINPRQAEKKAPHDAWTSSMFGWSLAGQFSHSQHPIIAIICRIKCEIRSHFAKLTSADSSSSDVTLCQTRIHEAAEQSLVH